MGVNFTLLSHHKYCSLCVILCRLFMETAWYTYKKIIPNWAEAIDYFSLSSHPTPDVMKCGMTLNFWWLYISVNHWRNSSGVSSNMVNYSFKLCQNSLPTIMFPCSISSLFQNVTKSSWGTLIWKKLKCSVSPAASDRNRANFSWMMTEHEKFGKKKVINCRGRAEGQGPQKKDLDYDRDQQSLNERVVVLLVEMVVKIVWNRCK